MSKSIVCFGAGPAFKGGMSDYNVSLAKAFDKLGHKVAMISWTHQYPSIIPREFLDKKSKTDHLKDSKVQCTYITNYNNPFTWYETANFIASLRPDQVIIQWSIAVQGLPISVIVKRIKKLLPSCEVILDLHFVIQKEQSNIDRKFTIMGIEKADTYVVHALKTYRELLELFPDKKFGLSKDPVSTREKDVTPVLSLFHPIYDIYKPDPLFDFNSFKQELGLNEKVLLFFGFIRKYKGLHYAIEAFAKVAKERKDVSFLICGELFWDTVDKTKFSTKVKNAMFSLAKMIFLKKEKETEKEQNYNPLPLIEKFGIQDRVVSMLEYVPNESVNKYFQVADAVVLFYEYATPSGIESLSYNFELPIIATKVGHFPETIVEGENGYLAEEADIDSMAKAMHKVLDQPIDPSRIKAIKEKMSWQTYAEVIANSKF
jgi:glycosyltransferase involved in cell wall biosynthesis